MFSRVILSLMYTSEVTKFAYRIFYAAAKSSLLRPALVWGIAHMSFFNSDRVLFETNSLICFHHPQPGYPVHILLVPKKAIEDILHLDPADSHFITDVLMVTRSLVETMNLKENGYRLVVNGGPYQDFPQLHFHLISGDHSQLP